MPDSYGRPLCSSPRLRWEISHAARIVRKTNETPAKATPTTYQMPVKPTPFRATRLAAPLARGSVSERTAVPGIEWAVSGAILSRERGWRRMRDLRGACSPRAWRNVVGRAFALGDG